MKTYTVTCIQEYIDIVSKLYNGKRLWYRGQSHAEYRLVPSAYRYAVAVEDWAGREIEQERVNFSGRQSVNVCFPDYGKMLQEFKKEAGNLFAVKPQNDIGWLCLGQHYGLPTPLLDWSTDPLIGLYFATCNAPTDYDEVQKMMGDCFEENIRDELSCCCASVFVIDPLMVNIEYFKEKDAVRAFDVEAMADYGFIMNHMESWVQPPICISGLKTDRRMCRQSGNFTLYSKQLMPMDFIEYFRKSMVKILIPFTSIATMREVLDSLDINDDSIYFGKDEKDEKAFQIAKRFNESFMKKHPGVFKA